MKPMQAIRRAVKRYFLVGLITLVPIYAALLFLRFFVTWFDRMLGIRDGRFLYAVPERFHPDRLLGFHVPGLGLVFSFLVILGVGAFSRNLIGRHVLRWGESLIARIPMASWIYNAVKQIMETLTTVKKGQFSRVVMIEYPRQGIYSLAFVTGEAVGEIQEKTRGIVLNVFVPTTPNPTSGFYLMVPAKDATPLDMTIEEAFRLIMSGGLLSSKTNGPRA
jgi:uncharacterized membrane protein